MCLKLDPEGDAKSGVRYRFDFIVRRLSGELLGAVRGRQMAGAEGCGVRLVC